MTTRDEAYLTALGRVSFNFQYLELTTSAFVWFLIGDQAVGRILTTGKKFPDLCNMLVSLFRHLHPDPVLIERLDALIANAAKSEQVRNQLIHSTWFFSDDTGGRVASRYKIRLERKRGVVIDLTASKPDEVEKGAEQISAATHALMMFMFELNQNGILQMPAQPQS